MSTPPQADWAPPQLRKQRCELSRLIEPGDLLGPTAVAALGVARTHELIFSGRRPTSDEQQAVAAAALEAGLNTSRLTLAGGLERWRTRAEQANGERDLRVLHRLGGGLIVPEDDAWPAQLNDLYPATPLGLYFRGPAVTADADPQQNYQLALQRLPAPPRSIAVVGSREMTDYGGRAAFELAEQLAGHGVSILSGGAYGIDAAAHRGALHAEHDERGASPTCAVLAGGVDRFYPAGNERLLRAVTERGLLLSEMAPGSTPTRHRFLHRNRIIAALAAAVVVIEARWRSGALSTAHHGLGLGRAVGAFPGSVYSSSSSGCHRLLRDTPAELVTDAAEVLEMIVAGPGAEQPALQIPSTEPVTTPDRAADHLNDLDQRLYDALPAQRSTTAGKLCGVAGLPMPQVLAGMSRLERRGLASVADGRWRRER
ncbi:DNA-processing protein DprA [Garicola koreensis]|uniref:DNA processing protein n=1 Tax=Garicola koreensis TaxID=1262554 RepID=A0A7W5TSX6_9MICC|nr:DNA-processing protein DprA [Garicola koreensis]MBB3667188.1 DNA processing protein [Garicola koreensis]